MLFYTAKKNSLQPATERMKEVYDLPVSDLLIWYFGNDLTDENTRKRLVWLI
jgi:hypothetical protein